jgi:hypothetical protein
MRFFLLTILAITVCGGAFAAERSLTYRAPGDDIREGEAISMLLTHGLNKDMAYEVASYDLNGDGVNEWVVKQDGDPNCEEQLSCRFFIAGLSERKPVLLAQITAAKINILTDKLYGIHVLAVYNNPNDDFTYTKFFWTPEKSRFSPL